MSLGELVLKLKIDDRAYAQGMRDAKRQAENTGSDAGQQFSQSFGRSLQSNQGFLNSIFQGIGVSVGITLANAAGRAFSDNFKNVIDIGTFFESTEASFLTALNGDAEKTKKLLQDVQDFAAKTTFSLRDVAGGSTTLLLGNEDPDRLLDTLGRLGNIAAGAQRPLQQLLNVYRDVQVAGEAVGGDKLQLKPFFPADLLRTAEGEDGKLQFEELQLAIQQLTDEGGRFFGLMDAQAEKVGGKISNLGDNFDKLYLGIYRDLEPAISAVLDTMLQITEALSPGGFDQGLFAGLAQESQDFADSLRDNPEAIAALATALEGGLNTVLEITGDLLTEAIAFLGQNPTALADAVEFGAETFRLFFDIVGAVLALLREFTPALQFLAEVVTENSEAVKVLIEVWAGYTVISKAAGAFTALSTAMGAVKGAMGGLSASAGLALGSNGWLVLLTGQVVALANAWREAARMSREYDGLSPNQRHDTGGSALDIALGAGARETYDEQRISSGLSNAAGGGAAGAISSIPLGPAGNIVSAETLDPPPEVNTYIPPGGIEALSSGNASPKAKAEKTQRQIEAFEFSLVGLGRAFERAGFQVREHSQFGDGSIGSHSPNSYHYYDEALDITHQTGEYNRSIELTRQARNLLKPFQGAGFNEVLGPGDPGHDTHLHLAARDQRITAVPSLLRALAKIGVSIPESQLRPVSVGADFADGVDLAGIGISAEEQRRREQQRIMEEAQRRADEAMRTQQRMDLQRFDDLRDSDLAQFDLGTAQLPSSQRGGRAQLRRLKDLRYGQEREQLQIDQAIAQLTVEGSRGEDTASEIEFLKQRKRLLQDNYELEAETVRADFSSNRVNFIEQENEALRTTRSTLEGLKLDYGDNSAENRWQQALKPVVDRFASMKDGLDERIQATEQEIEASKLLGLESEYLEDILMRQKDIKQEILDVESQAIGKITERIQLQEEYLRLERRSLEGRFEADILEATAGITKDPFQSAELQERAAIIREQLRYEQELFELRDRYADQPTVFEKLSEDAKKLHDLNIEGIQDQFKGLGETIGEEAGNALKGFGRDLLSLSNPLDAFINLLSRAADALFDIAFSQIDFGGIFGRDGVEIPSFKNGGESPYKPILGFFHGGEQILSDTTGEAPRYRQLQSMFGPSPLSSMLGSGGPTMPSMAQPDYSRGNIGSVGMSVGVTNNLAFNGDRPDETQIATLTRNLEERMALTATAVVQEQFRSRGRFR